MNEHRVPYYFLFLCTEEHHTHRQLTRTQTVVDSTWQTDPTYIHNGLSTLYCSLPLAFLPCPVARVAAQASLTANSAISHPVPLLPVDEMRWPTPYAGSNFGDLTRGHGTASRRGVWEIQSSEISIRPLRAIERPKSIQASEIQSLEISIRPLRAMERPTSISLSENQYSDIQLRGMRLT
jgi:hypothetical protein